MRRHWCARSFSLVSVLGVLLATLAVMAATPSSASGPVGSPSGPGAIVPFGHVPHQCTEADENPFGVMSGAIEGWAWSPVSHRWLRTPVCIIKWGYVGITPPVVAPPGAVTTFSILDESNLGAYIPTLGGASWAPPGEVVAGCTPTSMHCSVRVGVVNQHPAEWGYHLVQVTTPGAFVTWIPQVGCTEATPCAYLSTHAWSFVMIPPQPQPPTAAFNHHVSGAELSVAAISTDPLNIPLTHEWSFGDGTTRLGPAFTHVYRDPGTFTVQLTSTNTGGLSDTVSKEIEVEGEPLDISDLAIDPPTPQGVEPASFTFTVTNHGSEAVTGITPTVGVEPTTVMRRVTDDPLDSFDLAPGASREVTVPMQPRRAGEVLVTVEAGGQRGSAPTQARLRSLSVEVEASALRLTPIVPDEPPRQGEEFTVTAKVSNHGEPAIDNVLVTIELEPADRVEVVSGPEPAAPITLAPEGEAGDSAEVSWTLTAQRTAKVDVTFRATGMVDHVELEFDVTETVDLDADIVFEWEIAPRFADIGSPITDPADVTPPFYEFFARIVSINGLDCIADDVAGLIFQADGERLDATWAPVGSAGQSLCRFRFQRNTLDPFDLEAARVVDDVIDSVGEERVEARDFLIFSIGDSLSSGEGNPRSTAPIWTLAQCHRSAQAGPSAAAWKVEHEDPHSVVTFVHLACSGASTPTGLTGSYAGFVAGPWLPPQIPEISRFAGDREIDAVVMSVGANDIEFGKVVRQCVVSIWLCFNEELDDNGTMVPIPQFVATRVGRLDHWNDRNAAWLASAGVAPDRVYALTYPRVTRDHTGDYCPTFASAPGQSAFFMERAEWEWNEIHIEYPLNAAVVSGAGRHGWRWISGFAELFERHGYCSNDTWITSILGSAAVQEGSTGGGFHPNAKGHEVYRDRIYEALVADLYVGDRPRPRTTSNGATQVDGGAQAGSHVVQVRNDRFQVGDRVVINPGTPNAEVRTVVAKGSLVLDRPLAHDHPDGTLIVLDGELPGALDQVPDTAVPGDPAGPTNPPTGDGTPPSNTPVSAPPGGGGPATSQPGSAIPELPQTGRDSAALVVLALGLVVVGAVLMMSGSGGVGRRRGRESPRGRPAR